jgi:tRNA G18 (ribose-2'-O)-methylase SpoU
VASTIRRVVGLDDEQLAPYRDVGNPGALRGRGLFVAEGRFVVERLLDDARFDVESVVVTPAAFTSLEQILQRSGAVVLICEADVVRAVTGFDFHRGCLALAHRPQTSGSLKWLLSAQRLLVLEGVGNPDNIGGIFRTALALGAAGVILDDRCGDPLYRKAIRTSMAATLRVPFVRAPLADALLAMKANGFQIVALTPSTAAADISGLQRQARMALLLGAEGAGLSADVLALSDVRARIPIDPASDSLNVAVAAAIALHALR